MRNAIFLYCWCFILALPLAVQAQSTLDPVQYLSLGHSESRENGFFDVDGDGDMDVLSANSQSLEAAIVWFEQDEGAFLGHVILEDFDYFLDVQFVDVDQDGDPDVVYTDAAAFDTIYWLENTEGQFSTAQVLLSNAEEGSGFRLVDADADGDMDIYATSFAQHYFGWYENDGTLTFGDLQVIAEDLDDPYRVFAWDVDQDGDPDPIVCRDNGIIWYPVDLSGEISFGEAILLGGANRVQQIDTLDVDQDGDVDFCVNTSGVNLSFDQVVLFENLGGGAEFARTLVSGLAKATGVASADIDQDGYTDIVGCGWWNGQTLWYRNLFGEEGEVDFASGQVIDNQEDGVYHVAKGDYDNDGVPDLLTTGQERLNLQINDGAGNFTARSLSSRLEVLVDFELGDVDNDGLMDVVGVGAVSPNVALWLNTGNVEVPFSTLRATETLGNPVAVELADFNDDNFLDLWLGTRTVPGIQAVTFEPVSATLQAPEDLFWFGDDPYHLAVADVRPGGQLEGIYYDDNFLWYTYQLEDVEFFTSDWLLYSESPITKTETWELSGDERPEFVVCNAEGLHWFTYEEQGPDLVDLITIDDRGLAADFVSGDWNMDGWRDFAAAYPVSGEVVVYLTNGSATNFLTVPLGADYGNPRAITAADIDGDGDEDLIVGGDGQVAWILHATPGEFTAPQVIGEGLAADIRQVRAGDVNGDGLPEVFFASFSDDRLGFLAPLNNGYPLRGYCFWDQNENGVPEEEEPRLAGRSVRLLETAQQRFTTNDGAFQFLLPEGDFTLGIPEQFPWEVVGNSTTTVTIPGDVSLPVAIPLRAQEEVRALNVEVATGINRCLTTTGFWVTVQNTGTTTEEAIVSLTLDPIVEYESSEFPVDSIVGSTYSWTVPALLPGQTATISGFLNMPNETFTGTEVAYDASAYLRNEELLALADESTFLTTIRCAYDPNDKLAKPDRGAPDHALHPGELLTYTIRFQNTGNDIAFQVRLEDQLAVELDWRTLQPLAASHDYRLELNTDNGMLSVLFPNINLPDSTCCWAESQGFFTFSIEPLGNLVIGTEIENTASIFFDANAPIVTNTTLHVLTEVNRVGAMESYAINVQVFPNPTTGRFEVRLTGKQELPRSTSYQVRDVHGRLVFGGVGPDESQSQIDVQMNSLAAGVYWVLIFDAETQLMVAREKVVLAFR